MKKLLLALILTIVLGGLICAMILAPTKYVLAAFGLLILLFFCYILADGIIDDYTINND